MALQQIQKSSTFKPGMIGDVVEVTTYNKADGSMGTAVGVLRGYFTGPGGLRAEFDGDGDYPSIKLSTDELAQINLSVTHYEFVLDLTSNEEDGE